MKSLFENGLSYCQNPGLPQHFRLGTLTTTLLTSYLFFLGPQFCFPFCTSAKLQNAELDAPFFSLSGSVDLNSLKQQKRISILLLCQHGQSGTISPSTVFWQSITKA